MSDLPPLYARWFDDFGVTLAPETKATCATCPMTEAQGDVDAFDPASKCCTYVPFVPNYLVGAILAADDVHPDAASAIRARIVAGDAVTPIGVGRTAVERVLYERAGFDFGRDRSVRCPYYVKDGGACGVWKHRAAVCSTWFCKHVRGARGRAAWVAIHGVLERAEQALAKHCALTLGIDGDALGRMMAPLADRGWARAVDGWGPAPAGDEPPRVWGDWDWRVEAFFMASHELVAPMAWSDVRALGGSDVAMAERAARAAIAELDDEELPERAATAPIRLRRADARHDHVWTYSAYDPITLPRDAARGLRAFDEMPLADAMRALAMSEDDVRALLDHDVLVPAERLARGRKPHRDRER